MFKKLSFLTFCLILPIIFFSVPIAKACNCICSDNSSVGQANDETQCGIACSVTSNNKATLKSCDFITAPGTTEAAGGAGGSSVTLSDPLGSTPGHPISIPTMIGKVISAALGIVGSLALLMFIFGGFTWMLSAGSAEKVKKGKDIMIWAAIGLVIIFTSYTLVSFVISSIK